MRSHRVWLIFAPSQGVEQATPSDISAAITRLATLRGVRLVVDADGIWAFEWTPQEGTKQLTLAAPSPPKVGAWTLTGPAGEAVRQGPASVWHVISNGQPGYVVAGDYWLEPLGPVSAQVSLAAAATTNVELWDNTTNTLLERRTLSNTHGPTTVRLSGTVRPGEVNRTYAGWGPWRFSPKEPPPDHVLEVRVWSSGARGQVIVHTVSLTGAS